MDISTANVKVLLLGYDEVLVGGVTSVTQELIANIPEIQLLPILTRYRPRWLSILITVAAWLKYCSYIIFYTGKYPIVHFIVGSSGDKYRILPFLYVARLFRRKTCVQYHTSRKNIFGDESGIGFRLAVTALSSIDMHVFLSLGLRREMGALLGSVNTAIIANPIERSWFAGSVKSERERTKDIVFFGRSDPEKGVQDLITAVGKVGGEISAWLYSDFAPNVAFPQCNVNNWISREQVRLVMLDAKLLVLPSYVEAFPAVICEALACGTPFVASEVGGIPDIVEQSRAGLLVPPGDISALVCAIKKVLHEPDRWSAYSNNGRDWVQSLAPEYVIEKWYVVYNNLLRGSSGSHRSDHDYQ